jgi:hypothetical protein
MGRPLNKKLFGTGTGNQIQVRAKIGSAAEGNGSIVKQLSSRRFLVKVGSDTGACSIVDKSNGALAAGEMTISVKDEFNTVKQIVKITGKKVTLDTGETMAWLFGNPSTGYVKVADEAGSLLPVITIDTQPANKSVTAPADTSFAVVATVTEGATLSYQWQVKVGADAFVNVTNAGVYTGATTAALTVSNSTGLDTNQYRCVVSATGGASSVTSTAATLTVA